MFNVPLPLPVTPRSLGTKEGWAAYVAQKKPPKPSKPSSAEFKAMSEAARRNFDFERNQHHASFGPVSTSTVQDVHRALEQKVSMNLGQESGARTGAIIDGYANIGKTTILKTFGRTYELAVRRQHGDYMGSVTAEWHPVVYHTLTAQITVKSFLAGLADYYGAPYPSKVTTDQLTSTVVRCAEKCSTSVFLIDDIHYLDMRHVGAIEVNNMMKKLANDTSATFIYAGIGCQNTGLLTEGKGDKRVQFGQTRGRFSYLPVQAFSDSEKGAAEWVRLVKAFEQELVLMKSSEGMCTDLAEYLHQRTGGFIGSLSTLLRAGAYEAIQGGQERITRRLLDGIVLDHAAEENNARARRRAKTRRRSAG